MGKIAGKEENVRRLPAGQLYQEEISALITMEQGPVPTGWRMNPHSILTYTMGGAVGEKKTTLKYIESRRLMETAIVTSVTDRVLLLIGELGVAKFWLPEHLTAAINEDSTKMVQRIAGITEEHIRYSRDYTMLITQGPPGEAMIRSPVYRIMGTGNIARLEEISRCANKVQGVLVSILSEKRISIPELALELPAQKGFPVIAITDTRDRGVNEMSAALRRRFSIIILPLPSDMSAETETVKSRVEQLVGSLGFRVGIPHDEVMEKVCTIFRELRRGTTLDGKQKVKSSSGVLSTAEAASLLMDSMALIGNFGNGEITDCDLVSVFQDAVVKDGDKDGLARKEYLENVMRRRGSWWLELYKECKELGRQMGRPGCLGTRHLPPAGAYHLRSLLDERRSDLTLVGSPSDLNGLMNDMVKEEAKLLFAVMTFTKNSPIHTVLYPFAEYSPEYQTIVQAKEHGTQCRSINLPLDVFLGIRRAGEGQAFPEHTSGFVPEYVCRFLDRFNGEDGHGTFWERVIEYSENHGTYRDGTGTLGRRLRELTAGDDSDWPEILVREAYMKRKLRNTLKGEL